MSLFPCLSLISKQLVHCVFMALVGCDEAERERKKKFSTVTKMTHSIDKRFGSKRDLWW